MNCCVFSSDFDCEDGHCFEPEYRTARKDHICDECFEKIKKGEKYQIVTWITHAFRKPWTTFKTCLPCMRIRNDLFCGGVVYGVLQDAFYDCYGFSYLKVPE